MERYKIQSLLGDGSFGSVYLANIDGESVAIKKMKKKFYTWEECIQLREVKSLKKLTHQNIIKLREVIRENNELFFVFDYMEGNLYQLMQKHELILQNESTSAYIIYQVLEGVAYMHKYGFFHRDMKPENILVKKMPIFDTGINSILPIDLIEVKIADFGLAREIRSIPPYTDYISTRWYRAPELLLRTTNYSSSIDIWAIGCILFELITLKPLFPGTSELDQIFRICNVLGTPLSNSYEGEEREWKEASILASKLNYNFPSCDPVNFQHLLPHQSSPEALFALKEMLKWDPNKRPKAREALQFTLFSKFSSFPSPFSASSEIPESTKSISFSLIKANQIIDDKTSFQSTIRNNLDYSGSENIYEEKEKEIESVYDFHSSNTYSEPFNIIKPNNFTFPNSPLISLPKDLMPYSQPFQPWPAKQKPAFSWFNRFSNKKSRK